MAGLLSAQTVTWNGSTSVFWDTGTNWDGGTKPGTTEIALFSLLTPTNQPQVTSDNTILGFQLDVATTITFSGTGEELSLNSVGSSSTGSGDLTLVGDTLNSGSASRLEFNPTGAIPVGGFELGTGSIILDGGTLGYGGTRVSGVSTTNATAAMKNHIQVTANGGQLRMPNSAGNTDAYTWNTVALGGELYFTSAGGGNAIGGGIVNTITLDQSVNGTLGIYRASGHNGNDIIWGQITDGAGSAGNALQLRANSRKLILSTNSDLVQGANDYAGGTVIKSGSGIVEVHPSAVLGTGNVLIEAGGHLSLGDPLNNVGAAALVEIQSQGALSIQQNVDFTGKIQGTSSNGVYALGAANSHDVNLSTLGDGSLYLGSTLGGGGANFTGALTVGNGAVYRLGGGGTRIDGRNGAQLRFSLANTLTGANTLQVGGVGGTHGFGRVVFEADQNFTGNGTGYEVMVDRNAGLVTNVDGGNPFGDSLNRIFVEGQLEPVPERRFSE